MDTQLSRKRARRTKKDVAAKFEAPPKVTVSNTDQAPATKPTTDKLVRGAELTARARLEQLFDAGTFTEIDASVEHRARNFGMADRQIPGDGVVCGFGEIEGQIVYAYSQDRAVLGGSLGEAHAAKIVKIMDLAGRSCPWRNTNQAAMGS